MNTTLLAGLLVVAVVTALAALFVVRRRRAAVTFADDPAPVVIPLYDAEEEARKVRALAYAQKMGNMLGQWGGAAGQPAF
jgi:hypothetical protein